MESRGVESQPLEQGVIVKEPPSSPGVALRSASDVVDLTAETAGPSQPPSSPAAQGGQHEGAKQGVPSGEQGVPSSSLAPTVPHKITPALAHLGPLSRKKVYQVRSTHGGQRTPYSQHSAIIV